MSKENNFILLLLFFYLERGVFFAYVPARDQNHVVRAKKTD